MNKTTKMWLITATSLIVVGLVIFVAVMSECQWDFRRLNTNKYEQNIYEINEEFNNISINTDNTDISVKVSDDENCRVECYEEINFKHSVNVQEDTLFINRVNKKNWYNYIGIDFDLPKITVYLPKTKYTSLLINEKVGNIQVENTLTGTLEITVSTGRIMISNAICENDIKINVSTGNTTLTDIECKNVILSGETGDVTLKNVIATEEFFITRSTGNIKFEKCDAAEIFMKTKIGDVKGSLLSNKVFITKTAIGSNIVPTTTKGGKCNITTSTGNIEITVQ